MKEGRTIMKRNLVPRFTTGINISQLTDAARHEIVAGIKQASTTSAIVLASPELQASVTALVKKDGALTAASGVVNDDRKKLSTDVAVEAQSRSDLDGELRTYTTLLSNDAKSPADIKAAGVPDRAPRASRTSPLFAPDVIDNRPPKKGHGRTTVAVHDTGPGPQKFIAEQSPDGVTWTPLGLGRGKTRLVTGASGAKVWVRFARVRGSAQSEWSTPYLVTIP
jgi:hypothetical protein